MRIESLDLFTVFNSRVNYTVAANINGSMGIAPSGASSGSYEARSFVPEDLEAIEADMKEDLVGEEVSQEQFDTWLERYDGSDVFESIGSVAIASSLAFANASGFAYKELFPYPLGNVVGGGEHGGTTSIQEFLVIPVEAESFPEAVDINATIYHEFKERYAQKVMGMNDEGALITRMGSEEILRKLNGIAEEHGARVGLDMAANELWDGERYVYRDLEMQLAPKEQVSFVLDLIDEFELFYVEDPFHEDDFEHHRQLTQEADCLVVGDDLFVTNRDRLEHGVNSCNGLIVKPNQAGTVSRTRETVEFAEQNHYTPVISHRSGESTDSTIASLALAWNLPIIKAGIADIRIAKLNQLLLYWERMRKAGDSPQMADLPQY